MSEIKLSKGAQVLRTALTKGSTYFLREQYNSFIEKDLPKYFQERPIILTNGEKMVLSDFDLSKPVLYRDSYGYQPMYPTYALRNQLHYSGALSLKSTHYDKKGKIIKEKYWDRFCDMPIMLGTKFCNLYGKSAEELMEIGMNVNDPLGYYIMSGSEKFIYMQDAPDMNNYMVYMNQDGIPQSRILYRKESGLKKQLKVTLKAIEYNKKVPAHAHTICMTVDTKYINIGSGKKKKKMSEEDKLAMEKNRKRISPLVNIYSVFKLLLSHHEENKVIKPIKDILDANEWDRITKNIEEFETEVIGLLNGINRIVKYNKVQQKEFIREVIEERKNTIKTGERISDYDIILNKIKNNIKTIPNERVESELHKYVIRFVSGESRKMILESLNLTRLNADYDKDFEIAAAESQETPDDIKNRLINDMFLYPINNEKNLVKALSSIGLLTANLLLCKIGKMSYTMRDRYEYKIINTSVNYLLTVFDSAMKKHERSGALRGIDDFGRVGTDITNDFISKFRSWTLENRTKTNLATSFTVNTPLAKKTELLTINTLTDSKTKKGGVRSISEDQIRFVCLYETQDAERKGLIKPITVVSSVSIGTDFDLSKYVKEMEEQNLIGIGSQHMFINGEYIGFCNAENCRNYLLNIRRQGNIIETSIVVKKLNNSLFIRSDMGRLIAPVLIVKDQQLVADKYMDQINDLTYDDLLRLGIVEILDVSETIHYSKIAVSTDEILTSQIYKNELLNRIEYYADKSPEKVAKYNKLLQTIPIYTHCEFAKYAVVASSAAHMSNIDRTLADRVFGQTKKNMQASGWNVFAAEETFISDALNLFYPERSISEVEYDILDQSTSILGRNVVLAFMPFTDEHVEDGALINQAFVERGGMMTVEYVVEKVVLGISTDSSGRQCRTQLYKPWGSDGQHLNSDGLPEIGALISGGQIIIGVEEICDDEKKDASIRLNEYKYGRISRIWSVKEGNSLTIFVKLYSLNYGNPGNKIVFSWAQKFTMTRFVPDRDMPFAILADGKTLTIDVVINPLAPAARGSLPWIFEIINNITGIQLSETQDITTGREYDIDSIIRILGKAGYNWQGAAQMYSGTTGMLLPGNIMVGPSFMQVNKHMLPNKYIVRTTGKHDPTTGLPAAGKSDMFASSQKNPEQAIEALQTSQSADVISSLTYNFMDVNVCSRCGSQQLVYDEENDRYKCIFPKCENVQIVGMKIPGDMLWVSQLAQFGGMRQDIVTPTTLTRHAENIRQMEKLIADSVEYSQQKEREQTRKVIRRRKEERSAKVLKKKPQFK